MNWPALSSNGRLRPLLRALELIGCGNCTYRTPRCPHEDGQKRRGRPTQNAFIESFNGKFRDECLNQNWFVDVREARQVIKTWRVDYNTVRAAQFVGVPDAGRICGGQWLWKRRWLRHLGKRYAFPTFPPAATTAALFRPLQWNQKPWELRYDWTKNGGQVDVELVLEDRTTVVVGRNNSGKTSLSEVMRRFLIEPNPKFHKDLNNTLIRSQASP